MLRVSNGVSNALKGAYRDIQAYINFYIDGDDKEPIKIDASSGLIDFKILEEDAASDGTPFGSVSMNELDIVIDNMDKRFTADNENSVFYNKMLANIKVTVTYIIKTPNESVEIIGGVYYTQNWKTSTSSNTVNVVCYDRLIKIADKRINSLPVYNNIRAREFFTYIFNSIDLYEGVDYELDVSLNTKLEFIWLNNKDLLSNLRDLATSLGIKIYVNKYNKIVVRSLTLLNTPVDTITDNDLILKVDGATNVFSAYSVVNVSYKVPAVSEPKTILNITNYTIKPGINKLVDLQLTEGPAVAITGIKVLNTNGNVYVQDFTVGAFSIDLIIGNSGDTCAVDIEVEATVLSLSDASHILEDTSLVKKIGRKEYKTSISMPRDLEFIKDYSASLLDIVKDPSATLKIEMRGYPVCEVGDKIKVDSNIIKSKFDALINRFEYTYSGSLMCSCTVTKLPTVDKQEWAMVAPGLYTLVTI